MSTPLDRSKQLISKQANHGRGKPTTDGIQKKKKKKPVSETPLEKTIEMDMGDCEAVKIDFGWERHYKQIVLPDCKTLPMGSPDSRLQRPCDIDGGFDFHFHFSSD